MKSNKSSGWQTWTVVLCIGITGCATHHQTIIPLENGYIEVVHNRGSMMHESTQIELQYRKPDGKKMVVWPHVTDYVINNDSIVLIGLLHLETGVGHSRLFSFQPPGPVVDITDQVRIAMAKEKGESLEKIFAGVLISDIEKGDQSIVVKIVLADYTARKTKLDWSQILGIVRQVKENGVARKDWYYGTTYLEMKFEPEVQK